MNKGELIEAIAQGADLSKGQATDALNATFETIKKALKKKDKVQVIGFGTFSAQNRPARNGRNPRTGETIKIKAKNVAKFKAGKALEEALN